MKELTKPKMELLSPAGSMETLKAVALAGADAVYAAGGKFGARAYANNFTEEELLYAIDYLHLHNKRLYLTVNTLLKENELEKELYDYIKPLYQQGLDGVIIQDFGVLRFLREHFPGMELHASTQMSLTGVNGARLMKQAGCSRIVTARELSLEEIRKIHDEVDIEIESFVHGALCYCYSGQCLFSSILGGRSGNRGRCAQPCRLPYQVKNSNNSYLLSPKDLCTIELLPQIMESGVYSLKIEGRMKQAEYAAGVTSIYREYLEKCLSLPAKEYQVSPKDLKRLEELGSRSGFTKGYYIQKNGPSMMSMGKPAHTKSNDSLQEEMRQRFLNQDMQAEIQGQLMLFKGTPAQLILKCQAEEILVTGDVVQQAKSRPMDQATIEEKMKKTGGTGFYFEHLDIQMEEDIFIPVGALNQLRRDGIQALQECLLKNYRREEPINTDYKEAVQKNALENDATYLAVSVQTITQARQIMSYPYVDRIYIDSGAFQREQECAQLAELISQVQQAGKELYYIMPAILRGNTIQWYQENLERFIQTGIQGFVTGTYEGLELLKPAAPFVKILTDHSLYIWSKQAQQAFLEAGTQEITLPLEANERELKHRSYAGGELIIYGYLPLMVSAQCVVNNTTGCKHRAGFTSMTDRYDKVFTVKNQCKDCYNIIYNTSPMSLLHQQKSVSDLKADGYRISFTREKESHIKEIMSYYEQAFIQKEKIDMEHYLKDFTNGHFKRGVE